jgi:hypothetical protein
MGVCVGVSVGDGVRVKVNVGRGVNVAGMWVKVSVEGMPVDVDAGSGGSEAMGVPCALPRLQADVINIKRMGRINFESFMA